MNRVEIKLVHNCFRLMVVHNRQGGVTRGNIFSKRLALINYCTRWLKFLCLAIETSQFNFYYFNLPVTITLLVTFFDIF